MTGALIRGESVVQPSSLMIPVAAKIVNRFILVLLAFTLSGCYFTSSLWKEHDEMAQSIPSSPGKPQELFVDLKEKKICISYHPNKASSSNEMGYLVVSQKTGPAFIGPNYNIQIINDIFAEASHFNVSSVVANAQRHESSDLFILAFLGKPAKNIVTFEKDDHDFINNDGTIKTDIDNNWIGMVVGEEAFAKVVIIDQWQYKFGEQISPDSLRAVAWVNRENKVETSPIDYKTSEVNGVIMAVKPHINGIKYIKVKFNFGLVRHLVSTSDKLLDSPIVLNNHQTEPYYLMYGAFGSNGRVWWIPAQDLSWLKDNNCGIGDWIQLPTQKAQSFELYANTSKKSKGYDNPLVTRIVGSPFSVALDTVTFPIQFGFIFYVLFIHGMP